MADYYGTHWLRVMLLQPDVSAASEREALEAVHLADRPLDERVLDSACGFGRHLGELARRGYKVVGVDLSMPLLTQASLDESSPVLQADYRFLPFADSTFGVVLNLFTSFGFFGRAGDTAVLREFRRVLSPQGVLLLQVQHRERLVSNFRPVERHELAPGVVFEVRREFDEATSVQRLIETISDPFHSNTSAEISLTIYSADELVEMAGAAGFAEVQLFGGLDGREFSSTERAVIKASIR